MSSTTQAVSDLSSTFLGKLILCLLKTRFVLRRLMLAVAPGSLSNPYCPVAPPVASHSVQESIDIKETLGGRSLR